MMRKKGRHSKEKLSEALREAFSVAQAQLPVQPLMHINGRGWIELENCGGILEYDEGKIVFRVLEFRVTVYGEALSIVSLNSHITEIRGRIFRLDFGEDEE